MKVYKIDEHAYVNNILTIKLVKYVLLIQFHL